MNDLDRIESDVRELESSVTDLGAEIHDVKVRQCELDDLPKEVGDIERRLEKLEKENANLHHLLSQWSGVVRLCEEKNIAMEHQVLNLRTANMVYRNRADELETRLKAEETARLRLAEVVGDLMVFREDVKVDLDTIDRCVRPGSPRALNFQLRERGLLR